MYDKNEKEWVTIPVFLFVSTVSDNKIWWWLVSYFCMDCLVVQRSTMILVRLSPHSFSCIYNTHNSSQTTFANSVDTFANGKQRAMNCSPNNICKQYSLVSTRFKKYGSQICSRYFKKWYLFFISKQNIE